MILSKSNKVSDSRKQIKLSPNNTRDIENKSKDVLKPDHDDIVRIAGKGCYLDENEFNDNINEKIISHKEFSDKLKNNTVNKCDTKLRSNNQMETTHVDRILSDHKFKQVQTYLGDPVLDGHNGGASFGTLNDIGTLMIHEKTEDNPLPINYWYQ